MLKTFHESDLLTGYLGLVFVLSYLESTKVVCYL